MNKPIDITGVVLKTERLILRPFQESDLEDFYAYAKVDGVGQMAGWQPHKSIEESKEILDHFIQGKKTFALEYKGKVIGSLGIERYNEMQFRELSPYLGRAIGYVLSKAYWGRGLMPEAVEVVKKYLFNAQQLDFIMVGHFDWNRQSARVIHKSGFQYYATIPYETHVNTVETDFEYICFHPKYHKPLLKLPKIGILCAAKDELSPFLDMMQVESETKKGLATFYHGTLEGVRVTAAWCGVCKVNAAIATQILIDTYGCNYVMNAGVCGGMAKETGILDTIVSETAAHHDMDPGILTDYHPYMESIWFRADESLLKAARAAAESLPEYPVHFGRTVTGEAFIDDHNRASIKGELAPLSVDMETAAAAQVCHAFDIPFLAIRTVSDNPECSGSEAYHANCDRAGEIAADVTRQTVHEWKKQKIIK